jgi:hypothetical protein
LPEPQLVALPNWRSAPVTKSVSLSRQIGLDAGEKYVAFDFWNQALLGVVSDRMSVEVAGHDTRVVLVHRLLDRPQLIGTSRHITGAYSIRDLSWDAAVPSNNPVPLCCQALTSLASPPRAGPELRILTVAERAERGET